MLREADNTVINGKMYLPQVKLEQQTYREKNLKHIFTRKPFYTGVHSSIICNSAKLKATLMFIS